MKSTLAAKQAVLLLMIIALSSGCVTIPPEAPVLSSELGHRISALEEANLSLLHRFFDLKRSEVEGFVSNEWMPELVENIFSHPDMEKMGKGAAAEDNATACSRLLVMTGTKVMNQVNQKRSELMQPLDAVERRIEQNLRNEYRTARALNNVITSFLLSAAEVAENRDRFVQTAEARGANTGGILDEINDAVRDLLARRGDIRDAAERAGKYREKLRTLREELDRK